MSDPLLQLLIRCTVRVRGSDHGAGFYIAPGRVLTCAHVVGAERKPGDEDIVVMRPDGKNTETPARLIYSLPHSDDDLSLLEVTQDADDYVWLNDSNVFIGDDLLLYGFPKGSGDTRTAHYEGESERHGEAALFHHLFKGGQVLPGFSGAPLLNLRTGSVIGVVTETRGTASDLGGQAIPLSVVRELISRVPDLSSGLIDNAVAKRRWSDAASHRALIIRSALELATGGRHRLFANTTIQNFFSYYSTGKTPLIGASRRTQLDQLNAWLQTDAAPYLLIAAPAGRGKSALLVRWLEELASPQSPTQSDSTRVIFVPISVRFGLNTEEAVLRALVARLENAYDLPTNDTRTVVDLRDSFSEYLSARPEGSPNILLVIDGLDEAAGWEIGPGVFPFSPAPGVKVIVAARTQADRNANQWLEALGWAESESCRRLDLPRLTIENIADVITTLGPPLNSRAKDCEFVARLHSLSDGGDPLILSLYIEDLRRDPNSLAQTSAKGRPSGLDHYFDQWWKQQEHLWRGASVTIHVDTRHIFNLLATAFGPLPRLNLLELARHLRPECSGDDLDKALDQLKRFVLYEPENKGYVLAHPRFAEYRYGKLRRDNEHHQYETLFLEWGKATLSSSSKPSLPAESIAYIVRYYGAHLKRMDRPVEEFMARVSRDWQAAWDAVGDDYNGYFGDVAQSLEVARNSDRKALADREQLPYIGDEWRCAYVLANRKSVAQSLAPKLLGPLSQFGIWSGRRCLTFIQQLDQSYAKAEGLAVVIPNLPIHLLAEAEQHLVLLKNEFQETTASALTAYCVRLWEISNDEQALNYARAWPRGVARNRALVSLAARIDDPGERSQLLVEAMDMEGLDWVASAYLIQGIREEFARFAVAPLATSEDYEWVTPGLSAEARAEGLNRILTFIADTRNPSVTIDDVVQVAYGQHLELVLPWLRHKEVERLLSRYFALIPSSNKWFKRMAPDVISKIAPYLTGTLAETAAEAANTIAEIDEQHFALAILPLAPFLSTDKQLEIISRVLSVANDLSKFVAMGDRCEFVIGLVKLGLTDEVLELLRNRNEGGDESTDTLKAILPYLDLNQTLECVHNIAGNELAAWKEALPTMLARYASFGQEEARGALKLAQNQESFLAREIVLKACDVYGRPAGTYGHFVSLLALAFSDSLATTFGLDAIKTLDDRVSAQLSVSDFSTLMSGRRVDFVTAQMLATLAPYLSLEAALDPMVQSAYTKVATRVGYVDAGECISALGKRLVKLGEKPAAIDFAVQLPPLDVGVLPSSAIQAIPSLPPDLIERHRKAALRIEDPFHKCIALASIAEYIGDESWLNVWQEIVDLIWEPSLLDGSFRVKPVLEALPKPKAERAFANSYAHRFADPGWRNKFFDCGRVLVQIGRYYPAEWLEGIKITDIDSDSGTDRRRAFGTVSLRLAELGQIEKALAWLQQTGHSDPKTVAEAIALLPIENLKPWLQWTLRDLPGYEHYSCVWPALSRRWPEMSNEQMFALYELGLDMVSKRPRRWALIELLGFFRPIEQLGGRPALTQICTTVLG